MSVSDQTQSPQADAASMAEFMHWWFEFCTKGYIEVAWTNPDDRRLAHARQFPLNQLGEAVSFAYVTNSTPGQNVYLCGATVSKDTSQRSTDAAFCESPGIWLDQDKAGAADTRVDSIIQPHAICITGLYPHKRQQGWIRATEPIQNANVVRDLNSRLISLYHSDPTVVNACQLMRLPGSIAWPKKEGRVTEQTYFSLDSSKPTFYPLTQLEFSLPRAANTNPAPAPITTPGTLPAPVPAPAQHSQDGRKSITELIAMCFTPGQWHIGVTRLVAHFVERGEPDALINMFAPAVTWPGFTVDDTLKEFQIAIDTARKRWVRPDDPNVLELNRGMDAAHAFAAFPLDGVPVLPGMPPGPATQTAAFADSGFAAYRKKKGVAPEFVVAGLLPRGSVSMITGIPMAGKSPVAQSLITSVAMGTPWAGLQVQEGRVFIVPMESYAQTALNLQAYAAEILARRHNDPDTLRRVMDLLDRVRRGELKPDAEPTDADSDDLVEARSWLERVDEALDGNVRILESDFYIERDVPMLLAGVRASSDKHWAGEAPDVFVFDTLRAMSVGSVNKDEDMLLIQHAIKQVQAAFPRAVIIVIHHAPRGDPEAASGTNRIDGFSEVMLSVTMHKNGTAPDSDAIKAMDWFGPDTDGWRYGNIRLTMRRNKVWETIPTLPMVLAARGGVLRLLWGQDADAAKAQAVLTAPPASMTSPAPGNTGTPPMPVPDESTGFAAPAGASVNPTASLGKAAALEEARNVVCSVLAIAAGPLMLSEIADRVEFMQTRLHSEVAEALGLVGTTKNNSRRKLGHVLAGMRDAGILEETGVGAGSGWQFKSKS